jgi:M6 family metalloprotease-like protein
MRLKYYALLVLLCFIAFNETSAIIPPKKGVTPPADFAKRKSEISKSYKTGYYATMFAERNKAAQLGNKGTIAKDTVYALTLLGTFSDLNEHYTAQSLQTKLYDGPNPTGTITDYYREISYGKMYMPGSCKGWFKLNNTLASYVGSNHGLDATGGAKFVYDLVRASDNTINYADYIQYYDNAGNPHIGFIAAIHSGADAAAGANNIWSHRWSFQYYSGGPYTTNDVDPKSGKKVIIDGDYAIEPELEGSSNNGGSMVDIGVFCHEYGHIFGLPDLYDTDYTSEGVGQWCLMASGCYGGDGSSPETPTHMSAWCKIDLGWITPTEITSYTSSLGIVPVETNTTVYKIKKPNSAPNEYFLAENRQKIGYDKRLLNDGLLIYHIDDNISSNENENHYLVDVEQADGRRDLNNNANRGDAGDPFPGSTGNKNFASNTVPNSNYYSGELSNISIRDISKVDSIMAATFDVGSSPFISINSITLNNSANNLRVCPGDYGKVTFTAANSQAGNSTAARFTFSIQDSNITIIKPEYTFALAGFQSKVIVLDSAFIVKPAFQSKMVWVKYSLVCEGNIIDDSIYMPIGIPKILVVSKAEKKELADYYTASLNNNSKLPEIAYRSEPQFYNKREAIIVFSGKSADSIFTQTEIDSLTSYINGGGKVIFSGQSLASYLKTAYPAFLNNVLGLDWLKKESVTKRRVFGIKTDKFGKDFSLLKFAGNEGANNEGGLDVLSSPDNSFNFSFTYDTTAVEGGGGWKQYTNGGKVVFLPFGFESINNTTSSNTRDQLMGALLNWFYNISSVDNPVTGNMAYTLGQNYPNPFNPSTVISFSVPKAGLVTLKVYNLLGQEVATLVNGYLAANNYSVKFDAKHLTSGVYFYTIKAGDFSLSKKMMYIK